MFVLGHVGLTVTAVRAADRAVDLRAAALLSILPDLIDKPIYFLVPSLVSHNTRNLGHTLLAALAVLAVLAVTRRRRGDGRLLGLCYAGHMLLDLSWTSNYPVILLWPFLGPIPARIPESYLPVFTRYNIAGEAIGFVLLLALVWRHRLFEPARCKAFARDGVLS